MALTVVALALALVAQTCAEMTSVSTPILIPLSQGGGQRVVQIIQAATNQVNAATSQLNDKTSYCTTLSQSDSRKKLCADCVKQKCEEKAKSCGKQLTFSGVINSIADFGSNVISSITNIGGNVIDTIVDTGNTVIDTIGNIFGGWGRRRRRVRAEPSCSEFDNQQSASKACLKYTDYCSYCSFDFAKDCPGYTSVRDHYNNVAAANAWLNKIVTTTYQVESVSYDASSFNPATTKWTQVHATVNILGKKTTFSVNQPINPFDAATASSVIANQAMDWFKVNAK